MMHANTLEAVLERVVKIAVALLRIVESQDVMRDSMPLGR